MKRYVIFITVLLSVKAFAMSSDDKCTMLREEIKNALTTPNLNSRLLNESSIEKCFSAKMIVSNNYSGGFMNHYDVFMDNLQSSTTDILQIMAISDQVDASLSQLNGSLEESRLLVNTINVWHFMAFGKRFYAVVTGFGDDDYMRTTMFKGDSDKIVLMGAEVD